MEPYLYANPSFAPVGAGAGTLEFVLNLTSPSTQPITFSYATADGTFDGKPFPGTAVAGKDYTPASGAATFQPGQTSVTIPVTVLADPDRAPGSNHVMMLVLSNLVGAIAPVEKIAGAISPAP